MKIIRKDNFDRGTPLLDSSRLPLHIQIARLDGSIQHHLTMRQQASALAAVISYFSEAVKKGRPTKQEIYDILETACQWADGNAPK